MPFFVGYTHKSIDECQNLWRFYKDWFVLSGLKLEDIGKRYKTADKLRVDKTDQGFLLVCQRGSDGEVIGSGVCKDSLPAAKALFGSIAEFLDTCNEFKTKFAEQVARSLDDDLPF